MKNEERLNGLVCPECGSSHLTIVDTVSGPWEEYYVIRCGQCNEILSEYELIEREEYENEQ